MRFLKSTKTSPSVSRGESMQKTNERSGGREEHSSSAVEYHHDEDEQRQAQEDDPSNSHLGDKNNPFFSENVLFDSDGEDEAEAEEEGRSFDDLLQTSWDKADVDDEEDKSFDGLLQNSKEKVEEHDYNAWEEQKGEDIILDKKDVWKRKTEQQRHSTKGKRMLLWKKRKGKVAATTTPPSPRRTTNEHRTETSTESHQSQGRRHHEQAPTIGYSFQEDFVSIPEYPPIDEEIKHAISQNMSRDDNSDESTSVALTAEDMEELDEDFDEESERAILVLHGGTVEKHLLGDDTDTAAASKRSARVAKTKAATKEASRGPKVVVINKTSGDTKKEETTQEVPLRTIEFAKNPVGRTQEDESTKDNAPASATIESSKHAPKSDLSANKEHQHQPQEKEDDGEGVTNNEEVSLRAFKATLLPSKSSKPMVTVERKKSREEENNKKETIREVSPVKRTSPANHSSFLFNWRKKSRKEKHLTKPVLKMNERSTGKVEATLPSLVKSQEETETGHQRASNQEKSSSRHEESSSSEDESSEDESSEDESKQDERETCPTDMAGLEFTLSAAIAAIASLPSLAESKDESDTSKSNEAVYKARAENDSKGDLSDNQNDSTASSSQGMASSSHVTVAQHDAASKSVTTGSVAIAEEPDAPTPDTSNDNHETAEITATTCNPCSSTMTVSTLFGEWAANLLFPLEESEYCAHCQQPFELMQHRGKANRFLVASSGPAGAYIFQGNFHSGCLQQRKNIVKHKEKVLEYVLLLGHLKHKEQNLRIKARRKQKLHQKQKQKPTMLNSIMLFGRSRSGTTSAANGVLASSGTKGRARSRSRSPSRQLRGQQQRQRSPEWGRKKAGEVIHAPSSSNKKKVATRRSRSPLKKNELTMTRRSRSPVKKNERQQQGGGKPTRTSPPARSSSPEQKQQQKQQQDQRDRGEVAVPSRSRSPSPVRRGRKPANTNQESQGPATSRPRKYNSNINSGRRQSPPRSCSPEIKGTRTGGQAQSPLSVASGNSSQQRGRSQSPSVGSRHWSSQHDHGRSQSPSVTSGTTHSQNGRSKSPMIRVVGGPGKSVTTKENQRRQLQRSSSLVRGTKRSATTTTTTTANNKSQSMRINSRNNKTSSSGVTTTGNSNSNNNNHNSRNNTKQIRKKTLPAELAETF